MKKFILVGIISFLFIPFSTGAATNSGLTIGPYLQRVTKKAVTIKVRTESEQKLIFKYQKDGAKKWKTKRDSSSTTTHRYRLTSLKADKDYVYYLTDEDGDRVTQNYFFHTRKVITKDNPLKIAVIGDSGNGSVAQYKVATQMMEWEPEMMLHTGDVAYNDGTYAQFEDYFFTPYQPLLAQIPFYGSIGNHDYRTDDAGPYKDYFEYPTKLSSSEDYYSFNEDDVHIVALNSVIDYSEGSDQYNWLEQDLQDADQDWKIVFFHYPPYSSGMHGPEEDMRDSIVPLFEEYNVDLVLNGHDHTYERNKKVNGIYYIVTGGGGGSLYTQDNDTVYSKVFLSDYHFVGLTIYPKKIKVKAIDKSGYVFDRLTIK